MGTKFEAVVSGNLSETPLKTTGGLALAEPVVVQVETDTKEDGDLWENLGERSWTEPKLGESVANSFRQTTRRMRVNNGYLYSTATCAICYIRGVAAVSTSEALQFVEGPKAKK